MKLMIPATSFSTGLINVRHLWHLFFHMWNGTEYHGVNFPNYPDVHDILFRIKNMNDGHEVLNFCILHIEYYIYTQRLFHDNTLSIREIQDVQLSCAINQTLLAHHWRVHQCLLTSCFIARSIPWGASAPGGKMRKQLLKDHNFLNNSPIFIIESSTGNIFAFQKALHTITIWKIVLDLVKGTWHHNFMTGCGSLLWANTCSLWSGIKSWPGAGWLQRLVRRSCQ